MSDFREYFVVDAACLEATDTVVVERDPPRIRVDLLVSFEDDVWDRVLAQEGRDHGARRPAADHDDLSGIHGV